MITTVTKDNFDEFVSGEKPALIDFWASWCGPCKMLSPLVDEAAEERADTLVVGKVNVDEQPELAIRFGVMSIPTLMLFAGGQLVAKSIGYMSKDNLNSFIEGK